MENEKKSKGFLNEMKQFYILELKSKHMWNFVISLFVYFALVLSMPSWIEDVKNNIYNKVNLYDEVDVYEQIEESIIVPKEKGIFDIIKQQSALSAVVIFSGITPYINIPVILTVVYPFILAFNIYTKAFGIKLLMSLGAIIELFITSLIVSIGMYWCKMATKHFRYNQSSSFTMNDVKLEFYEALNKNEKIEQTKAKMKEKYEKTKEWNVKTNYKALIFFSVVSTILICIITCITGV